MVKTLILRIFRSLASDFIILKIYDFVQYVVQA